MIRELAERLDDTERAVVQAVFDISPETIDGARSSCEERNNFLICRVVSSDDSRCPFEFHFGQDNERGRFNFFFGLGAELHNYESLEDPEESEELAEDVSRFLRSTISCERTVSGKGDVISERYSPDQFVVGGVQTHFWYRSSMRGWVRRKKEMSSYRPWMGE
ncbi:MAG: hypothetical protein QNK05_00215 [Myxococcota bacterium]|nr:hypothetical protein [Myxococcota bacterium]